MCGLIGDVLLCYVYVFAIVCAWCRILVSVCDVLHLCLY